MRGKKLLRLLVATSCASALCSAAQAEEPARFDLRIERQSLSRALQEFAKQSGVQIVFFSKVTDGYLAPSLNGTFTAAAALDALLDDSQLTFRELTPNTIEVRPKVAADDTQTGLSSAAAQSITRVAAQGSGAAGYPAGTTRLAQSEAQSRSRPTGNGGEPENPQANEAPAASSSSTTVAIPDILVVGSRILNADIRRTENDAQPYMIFERADLERSGARNVEDFLMRRLTASTSSTTIDKSMSAGGDSITPTLGNTSSIDLRGLGPDETLILLDGRRIAGFARTGNPSQPDINGIPLAAIERIEVLPATASGIYGGGATGGVINIVLRRDFDGVDLKLTYGNTFDGGGEQNQIDLGAGFSLEEGRTSILIAASYSDTDELTVGDRDLLSRGQARILANNPNALVGVLPPLGATTNISSVSVGGVRPNLTLDNGTPLSSPITFVPPGYAGPASDSGAGLVANAGQYNLNLADVAGSGGARQSLLNAPTVKSVNATMRREFTSWLDAYIELATSQNKGLTERGLTGSFQLDPTAPSNPFQQAIRVTTPILGVDSVVESVLDSDRAAAGLIVSLPRNWRAQADYTWNRTNLSFSQPSFQIDSAAAEADVASGALDVFRDTNGGLIDFSPYLGTNQNSGVDTTLDNVALRFSGPLPLLLPGGASTLSLLFEYRKEEIGDQIVPTIPPPPFPSLNVLVGSRSQSVNSAYLELRLPIVSDENAVPAVNLLELQLAGRYDDYETKGADEGVPLDSSGVPLVPVRRDTNRFDSANPTFGVRYKPLSDVMLRASYGTGFLPASVNQIVPAPAPTLLPAFIFPILGLTDPRRGGEFVGASLAPGQDVAILGGGNPDLEPEESESWSAGLVLTPRFVPGLRVSADWTRTEKTGNIGLVIPTQQANLDLEQLIPGLVTRDTDPATFGSFGVGPIIGLDSRLRNVALTKVEAYDFALDYRWASARFGEFALSTAATRYVHNETRAVPLAPIVENSGTITGLPWRGHATLSWEFENWSAAWTARHFDSYRLFAEGQENAALIQMQGSPRVPSQTYHDLFASFRFDSQTTWLSGTEIQLGVNNVFNTRPPVDVTQGLFYSTLGDPRLASYYISLRKSF